MTYAEDIEELAYALSQILGCQDIVDGDDVPFVLAARDTVVKRLRALSGAVINAGPAHEAFPARHIAADPAHALHAALRDLGLASGPDRPATIDVLAHPGRGALPHWQAAARASALLELYDEALRILPGPAAWAATRDIADLAATLPHIDADLARRVPPGATRAKATLTDIGTHGAIRIAADELLARAPDLAGPRPDIPTSTPARAIRIQSMATLPEGIRRLTAIVNARAEHLTASEARAVAKALADGMQVASHALKAASQTSPRFSVAARGLDRAVPAMRRIYLEPMETLTPPFLALNRLADEIRHQLRVLRALVDRIAASDHNPESLAALARAAGPALAVAMEIPDATAALDCALHAAHNTRQLLSPVEYQDGPGTSRYLWVRAQAPESQVEPLAIAASRTARAALRAVAPMLESASPPALDEGRPDNADQAARALEEIRVAIARRSRTQAESPTPDHPRLRVGSSRRELPISQERSRPRQSRRR